LMKLTYLKSAKKFNSFDVTASIKILFVRVSVTIEPHHSLFIVCYHEGFCPCKFPYEKFSPESSNP